MGRSFGSLYGVCASACQATFCASVLLASSAVQADFLGARISAQGTIVSIEQPEENPEDEVTRFLVGPSGAVAAFIRQIDTMRAPGPAASVTVLLESTQGGSHVFRASRSGSSADASDESFAARTPAEFATALCRISQLCGVSVGLPAGAAGAPTALGPLGFASRRPDAQIVVELGEFPAAAREILLRREPVPLVARAQSTEFQDPLTALMYRTVQNRARSDSDLVPPMAPEAPLLMNRPVYFAVHCTAFNTSLDSAAKWVERLRREGKRAKSHGVILANGAYHEIWPLSERPVYATKTETCAETKASALGSVINVELHYHCGYEGRDPTVLREATPEQYKALAELYLKARQSYGDLIIVSHKEIDRGLRDGHRDPLGFSFDRFLLRIRELQADAKPRSISDARQRLPTTPGYSHTWQPRLDAPLVPDAQRPDDCKRDTRPRSPG
jgi:hypothetical protein